MKKLIFLIALSSISCAAQTTNTNTDCTIYGNTASCTSTSTDDSAQRQAEAAAQAEKDRQGEELGKSMGNAMGGLVGLAIRKHAIAKQYKAYCNQHAGEPWARRDAKGTVLDQGTCPGTLSKQWVVDKYNREIQGEKLAGYVDSSGSTLTIHLESMSEMRFHMISVSPEMAFVKAAGYQQLICTDDKDQKYTYDVLAGRATPIAIADHVVTPAVPAAAPAVIPSAIPAPTLSGTTEALTSANAASSGVLVNVSSTPSPSTPTIVPAVSVTVPKACNNAFRDKAGHEVCLDQH